jgi:hypothetical protein
VLQLFTLDVDVAHQMRAPMRCQQSIHQCLQAISLLNVLQVYSVSSGISYLQQLGRTPNAA